MLKQLRGHVKSISLLILFTLVSILIVYAIGTNDVSFNSPADNLWFSGTNYTKGFNFTWSDPGDTSYEYADCTLYINTSSTGIVSTHNEFGEKLGVANYSDSTIYMNRSFFDADLGNATNDTTLYWTVQCCNTTASPNCWAPSARSINTDMTWPKIHNKTLSFTNNSWLSGEIRIEVNVTDTRALGSDSLTCEITNNSVVLATTTTSETTINGTLLNITTSSIADGLYTDIRYQCRDPAGNTNTSFLMFNVSVDKTNPIFVSFNDPTPAEGSNSSSGDITFNFTVTETNANSVILEFDGANVTMDLSSGTDCNATGPPFSASFYCNITNSSIGAKKDYVAIVYVDDYAGNEILSSTRTFSVDLAAPQFNRVFNWTVLDSIASFNFEITDTTPATCSAKIYDRHGNFSTTVAGTLGDIGINRSTGTYTNCTGTFNSSDVILEGTFTVKFNMTDGIGESNETRVGGVMTRLYEGWNTVTYPDSISNLTQICTEVEFCEQVARFNNTGKSFKTFSISTPTANDEVLASNGDGILIYVNATSYIITNDNMPYHGLETAWNFTLQIPGWNLVGLLNNASMNTTLHVAGKNATTNSDVALGINMSYAAWRNASAELYYTCKRSIDRCSGTTVRPKNINLKKGYGVWMLPLSNYTINRSTITG